jgi:hypothetical protein
LSKRGPHEKRAIIGQRQRLTGSALVNEMYRRVIGDLLTPTINLQEYADAFFMEENLSLSESGEET